MSARETDFPVKQPETRKLHQAVTLVGKNGLVVDALASLEPGTTIIPGGSALTYASPTVTFDPSVDLSAITNYKTFRHTGKIIFSDAEGRDFFLDVESIDNTAKTANIYIDEDLTASPSSIVTDAGWLASEGILVNRLQTTNSAVIDSVEFRDVSISFNVDGTKGDSVKIVDSQGQELNINPDGSIDANVRVDLTEDSISIGDGEDLYTSSKDAAKGIVALDVVDQSKPVAALNDTGRVTQRDADGNPTEITFRCDGVVKRVLTIEYDDDGNFDAYTKA